MPAILSFTEKPSCKEKKDKSRLKGGFKPISFPYLSQLKKETLPKVSPISPPLTRPEINISINVSELFFILYLPKRTLL